MHMHAFDTLQYSKDLQQSGMPEAQAEAVVRLHAQSLQELVDNRLATKEDIKELRIELKGEMSELRGELSELRGKLSGALLRHTLATISALAAFMAVLRFIQ